MKIAITGATGLIGKALSISLIKQFHDVIAWVRNPERVGFLSERSLVKWDGVSPLVLGALQGVDAVVHLMGEPVAEGKWTSERKKRILSSRVESTELLVNAIRKLPVADRPRVLICASAIGIYGERGEELLTEESLPGAGFLAEVTLAWEKAAKEVEQLGVRLVLLRTGVVLSREGGALPKMQAATLGSGKQWMSWIHLEDVVSVIEYALKNTEVAGPYNLVSPEPVTNKEFAHQLSRATHFPIFFKVPEIALKFGLGEMASVILASQRVLPQRILKSGYVFKFQNLAQALTQLFPDGNYLRSEFQSAQFIPRSVEEVFPFFGRAENLEKLTPRWLNFKITQKSTPQIENHTLIEYQLKIHGVPVKWRTQIESWEPGVRFVDEQLKGPYSKWHHEHDFSAVPGGTLMQDRVTYQVPGKSLGKFALGSWIRSDIQKIFDYRKKIIKELFPVALVIGALVFNMTGSVSRADSSIPDRVGLIYPLGKVEGKPLFTQKTHYDQDTTGKTTATSSIVDSQGKLVMTEIAIFQGTHLISQLVEQLQTEHQYTVSMKESQVLFTDRELKEQGKEEKDDVKLTSDFITGPTTQAYLESHWDELLSGKTVHCRFGVLESKSTFGFNFKLKRKEVRGDHENLVVSMKPSAFFNNLLFSVLEGEIEIELDSVTKRYVHYKGITPVQRVDEKGKNHRFAAEIIYE